MVAADDFNHHVSAIARQQTTPRLATDCNRFIIVQNFIKLGLLEVLLVWVWKRYSPRWVRRVAHGCRKKAVALVLGHLH